MPLGNRLKEVRDMRELTLRQVGAAVGLDPTYLSRIERGQACSDRTKLALAAFYGVPVGLLFFVEKQVESTSTGAA